MSRKKTLKEERELDEIRQNQLALARRQKEAAEIPRRLALELEERERTMPPLPEIEERERRLAHENIVSRGEATNLLREQNRSLLLFVTLLAAVGTLIWWGIQLMDG